MPSHPYTIPMRRGTTELFVDDVSHPGQRRQLNLTAGDNDNGRRLDRILRKALPDMPLSAIHRLLRQGLVLVNGEAAGADYRVQSGQLIVLDSASSGSARAGYEPERTKRAGSGGNERVPLEIPEILFEGEGLLILNKPAGIEVHGKKSLEEIARFYLAPKLSPSLSFKPGPLHRLDRPTSGIIVFSANIEGARFFSALMRKREIKKQYLAIVEGVIQKSEIWREELFRDNHLKKTFTSDSARNLGIKDEQELKAAITLVRPLAKSEKFTLVLAEIETGRTHQIRAQAASRGHPLSGDRKYGSRVSGGGLFLHAWRVEFPQSARSFFPTLPLLIEAPLPDSFHGMIFELFGSSFELPVISRAVEL